MNFILRFVLTVRAGREICHNIAVEDFYAQSHDGRHQPLCLGQLSDEK
jgi:hypothetical protein